MKKVTSEMSDDKNVLHKFHNLEKDVSVIF